MAAKSSCMNVPAVVGRLAPSPTGALHLGNARSFLLAWLSARQGGGEVILRIEDIDSPRVKPWAVFSTIEDLTWLGLDWDIGPDKLNTDKSSTDKSQLEKLAPPIEMIQTRRLQRYNEVLDTLIAAGKVYPCTCTRSEVAEAASAPHESSLKPLEGPIYPGTCRTIGKPREQEKSPTANQDVPQKIPNREFAYRWAFDDREIAWHDSLKGPQSANALRQLGDFVIAKSNGTPAYQLAVVVDDFDMGITEVVRGDDLLASTYRQLAILDFLGWPIPKYYHVPLVIGPDGRRLAKRHGDTRLSYFRELGISSKAIVGYLAWSLHLMPEPAPVTPQSLIAELQWDRLPKTPTTFDLAADLPMLREMS